MLRDNANQSLTMNILIINLPRHTDRLAFQQRQMDQLGLHYQLVRAVDVNTVAEHTYQALCDTWERPMRKVEVCCYLSHQSAWEIVEQSGQPALILEDDALLSNQVPELLEALKGQALDLVTLEVRGRKKVVSNERSAITGKLSLLNLYQDRTGAAGYVLYPSGARKLLNKAAAGRIGITDAFISSHYALNAFQVEPAAIIQLDMCEQYGVPATMQTTSSIGSVERPAAKHSTWRFQLRRIQSQLRMGWRILSVWHKAQRRFIALEASHFQPMQK